MAIIEKRGPLQFRVRIRKKGFQVITKTFTDKRNAEAWSRKTESEMERGVYICATEAEQTTLGEALERYAGEVTSRKRNTDMEFRRIKTWQAHPLAGRMLASIRGVDMAAYRDERRNAGKAPNTIRLELAIISHLFTVARKEWGMESLSNPVQSIRLPPPGRPRDRRLKAGEEEKLLDAAKDSRSREIGPIISLALETAARREEILKMAWEHISLAKQTWHIPETKNTEPRTVPLSTRAVEILRKIPHRIDGRVWGIKAPHSITQAFDRVCKQAGIEGLHFHDLRHEAASRLFEKGLGMMEVAAVTGHKTLTMLKRYTHLRAEDLAVKLG